MRRQGWEATTRDVKREPDPTTQLKVYVFWGAAECKKRLHHHEKFINYIMSWKNYFYVDFRKDFKWNWNGQWMSNFAFETSGAKKSFQGKFDTWMPTENVNWLHCYKVQLFFVGVGGKLLSWFSWMYNLYKRLFLTLHDQLLFLPIFF